MTTGRDLGLPTVLPRSLLQHQNTQYYCSASDFIQTANGGMQFV